jgi:glycosyltransferase involved in cell wall biosynthesis
VAGAASEFRPYNGGADMTPIRVLELRSVRGTGGGPEKTILLGAARSNPDRYAVTVCYIRDARDPVFAIDRRAAALSIDYVEILERHSFDRAVLPALRRIARERRIDIVHAHDYKTDVLGWWLRRAEGVIAMSTAHGWAGHTPRERLVYHPLDKMVLRSFPRVIAVADDIRHELIRSGVKADRVQTILNGIDHTHFRRDDARERDIRQRLNIACDDIVIGAVGRLEQEKRYDLLIDAFARLRSIFSGLRLLIAGEGRLRGALQHRIDELGLSDVCQLLGQRDDVIDLYHAFTVFVQSSSNEGASNALLEAMALETAIVATEVGGTPQVVRHTIDGLLVPGGSSEALAHAVGSVISDPVAAARRVASARRRVETTLSFDTRMATLEAVYSDLYTRHKARGAVAPMPA